MQVIDAALVTFTHCHKISLSPYLDWLCWHSLIEEQPHHVDDLFQVSYFPILILQGLQMWEGKGSTSSEDGQLSMQRSPTADQHPSMMRCLAAMSPPHLSRSRLRYPGV